jgi:hypothetical protein
MGKHGRRHARSSPHFRYRYPVLAAGAILAVAGVSSFLVGGGKPSASGLADNRAPATTVLAGGEEAASASSSATALTRPTRAGTPTVTPAVTPTAKHTSDPTVTPSSDPAATSTSDPRSASSDSGQYFGLAPAGTSLPRSDAYCASHVQPQPEVIPANRTANHDTPPAGTNFDWGPWVTRNPDVAANFAHVDGDFAGTTGEILEWAACKWGWSQDFAMAEAFQESTWVQSTAGDNGHSFGILQVRASPNSDSPSADLGWGGFPWTEQSTALDADAQMAYLRSCYDGDTPWLGNGYQAGNVWGCIGSWYSGDWLSAAAEGYISRVQAALNSQAWLDLS